jgi:hypothetical protein
MMEYFNKYEARLGKLEEMVSNRPNTEDVKQMIEESKSGEATRGERNIEQTNEKLDEYIESVARRNNIIIFRAKESEETEPEKRKAEDMNIVKELCKITEAKYVHCFWLHGFWFMLPPTSPY